MTIRHFVPMASTLALGIGLVVVSLSPKPTQVPLHDLEPGAPLAAVIDRGTAHFDLGPAGNHSFVLIVSSLGSSDQTFSVEIAAITNPTRSAAPLTTVAPLPIARLRAPVNEFCLVRPPPRRQPGSGTVAMARRDAPPHESVDSTAVRSFFLHVTDGPLEDPRHYTEVHTRLAAEGTKTRLYVDAQISLGVLPQGLTSEIVRLLDDQIIPRSAATLGVHDDVDGDGKLAVLVTPWLARLRGGQTSVNGFVRSDDFRSAAVAPFSNHADVLYLNSEMKPGPALTALLAHEYAHAVCFSRRFAADRGIGPLAAEEDWLNEAIAHVAENLHDAGWSNLDYRIAAYLTEPQRNPLVVADYYRAGLWRDPGCRGAAYLFLRWCLDHYGDALVRELVNNSATGCHNIEQVTGIAFEDLYRHWTIALWNGAFTSINLRDRLGDCRLSGPAMRRWNPECEDCRLELRGMATAFVEVCNLPNEAPRRLKIQASPGARLQVTVIPDR